MVEARNRALSWTRWSDWLLWWKIDPEELRRQVEGYSTIKRLATARGLGFLVSVLLGVPKLILGVIMFVTATDLLWVLFAAEVRSTLDVFCPLIEGLLFLVLGYFLFRGKRWAILGMMVFATLDVVIFNSQIHYYLPLKTDMERAMVLIVSLLGWSCFMHVLYTALSVERERTRAA